MVSDGGCCPPNSLGAATAASTTATAPLENVVLPAVNEDLKELRLLVLGSGPRCLLIAYDVFGFEGHSRIQDVCQQLLDRLVAGGADDYCVVMPDFFRGDDCETAGTQLGTPSFFEWVAQWKPRMLLDTLKLQVLPFLKKKFEIEQFAMLGFCWGGWLVERVCIDTELRDKIVCAIGVHPSLAVEGLHHEADKDKKATTAVKDLIDQITTATPHLLLPASNDNQVVHPGGLMETTLKSKCIECQVHLFADNIHGFVTRSDISEPNNKRDVEQALDLAAAFCKKHLK